MPPRKKIKTKELCASIDYKKIYRYIDEQKVFCLVCEKDVATGSGHEKQRLDEHRNSSRHKELVSKRTTVQPSIESAVERIDHSKDFNYKLTKAFIAAGIPLSKVNDPSIKNLFEVDCGKRIYDRRHLTSKYIPLIFEELIGDIRKSIGNSFVYFIIDESPDIMHRSVVNVLVGKLDGHYSKPHLLKVDMFDCSVDNTIVSQVIINACIRLWPEGIKYQDVLFIISDAAAYMKKAYRDNWKTLFPNSIHITCLAHAIHNLCDTIRLRYNLVNSFVAKAKERITASIVNRNALIEAVGFLPPKAVITRWGTFLEAAEYYLEFFDQVKDWIESMDSESQATSTLKQLIDDPDFKLQLLSIKNCFFLVQAIKEIEKQGLSVNHQLSIINDIKNNPILPQWAKDRFNSILEKNEGIFQLKTRLDSLVDLNYNNRVEYVPLVSADVERSFSQYKYILNDRRTNLGEENIEKINMLMFNKFIGRQSTTSSSNTPTPSTSQAMSASIQEIDLSDDE